ncbi:MAG: SDR family oxidoreductase [Hyphomicrobiaceae bacterium]|nr:MAG: SDR family oxidoreductase [Hyphomicrobiaceae bacterium]
MRGLKGKTAIVTGGAGAIGRAICRRLAEEGVRVGVFDKDAAAAAAAAEAVSAVGPQAVAQEVDISSFEEVAAAVAAFESAAGPTSILVNNAGFDKFAYFLETGPELWDQLIAVNLKGPINLHHAVLKGMQQRRAGRVINIASDAGRVGSSMEAVYSACKGGIIAFTKTMAREMARSGVTLNAVCPGPTDTPLLQGFLGEGEHGMKMLEALRAAVPMKRLGQPDDIPGIVAFLASDDAAYMTGQVISVSGGLTMNG